MREGALQQQQHLNPLWRSHGGSCLKNACLPVHTAHRLLVITPTMYAAAMLCLCRSCGCVGAACFQRRCLLMPVHPDPRALAWHGWAACSAPPPTLRGVCVDLHPLLLSQYPRHF